MTHETRQLKVQENRAYFPRGLVQPEGFFRFSLDSLLLGSFVSCRAEEKILDLGTGCGIVGLSILLLNPDKRLQILGLDSEQQMLQAALENAKRLGLKHLFKFFCLNIKEIRTSKGIEPESFSCAVLNPPYRETGSGRFSPKTDQNMARFELEACLADFIQAAFYALQNKGKLYLVYLAERMAQLFEVLRKNSLEAKLVLPVYSKMGTPAKLCLIQAQKNAKPGLKLQSPLILYHKDSSTLTPQALEFCPFLTCNPTRS